MSTFSDYDLIQIQSYIDAQLNKLSAIGLELTAHADMQAFADLLRDAPDAHAVPSTHDPNRSHVDTGNAFWTALRDQDGRIVGCNGQRMYETDDLFEDIRTHAFFKNRVPVIHHYPLPLLDDLEFPAIAGRLSIGGGMWVHPDWRGGHKAISGAKIYGVYSPLVRAIALRHFKLNWYCAFYGATAARTSLGRFGSGFPNSVKLLNGMCPLGDRELEMQFMWMSREEMLQFIFDRTSGSRMNRQA